MTKLAKTEQWKLDGDCGLCRRVDYCRHECTAYKNWFKGKVNNAIEKALDDAKDKSGAE